MAAPFRIEYIRSALSRMIQKLFLPSAGGSMIALLLIAGTADMVCAMATPPGGGTGQPQGPGAMLSSFLPLILIFVIFYFLLIRPQSKKAKEHKQMLDSLKKGDKILTNGGIHGVVEDIDGETLTVKIGVGSDVKVKVSRGHIAALRGKE